MIRLIPFFLSVITLSVSMFTNYGSFTAHLSMFTTETVRETKVIA